MTDPNDPARIVLRCPLCLEPFELEGLFFAHLALRECQPLRLEGEEGLKGLKGLKGEKGEKG
jgi:hypothetical protein